MKAALLVPGVCFNIVQSPADVLAQYKSQLAQPLQPVTRALKGWRAADQRLWAQVHVAKVLKEEFGKAAVRAVRSGPERIKYAQEDSEKLLQDPQARWIQGASFLLPAVEGQDEGDPRHFYVRPFLLERLNRTKADEAEPDSFRVHEAIAGLTINPAYIWQLSVETYLLRKSGLPVSGASLWVETGHNQYEQRDVTEDVESRQAQVATHIQELSAQIMALPPLVLPDTNEGMTDYPVSALLETGNGSPKDRKKYQKYDLIDRLVALGILDMRLVPEPQTLARDFPRYMDPKHVAQIAAHVAGRGFIDQQGLGQELAKIKWPVFSVDFETTIPKQEGGLYVPHQFASRIVRRDGSVVAHDEFLPESSADPRLAFARALVASLEREGGQGSILVYHADFENRRIQETSDYVKSLGENELAEKLLAAIPRVVDLLAILRRHVYLSSFGGSFSLKSTYPGLTGVSYEESYEALPIKKGDQAAAEIVRLMDLFRQFEAEPEGSEQKSALAIQIDELRKNLFDYCGLDVKAPLKVLFELIRILDSAATA